MAKDQTFSWVFSFGWLFGGFFLPSPSPFECHQVMAVSSLLLTRSISEITMSLPSFTCLYLCRQVELKRP